MNPLILYYSYQGNTQRIAEEIHRQIGSDLLRIDTAVPYSGDYQSVVDQGQRETDQGFCPELQPLSVDLGRYDTLILGSPVWWYTFAPAMRTFLSQTDLTGKIIYPFATNGGWPGHTLRDFGKYCKGALVKPGLSIRFDGTALRTPEADIRRWIQTIR